MTQAELLRCLDETHRASLALLEQADPFQIIYEETEWRVKDIVAHVATWDTETLRAFHAHRRGGAYSIETFTSVDDFNAYAAHMRMNEPMEQIMADWQATHQWLHILFNAMTEEDFSAEMTYPSGKRGTARDLAEELCTHEAEHMQQIRAKIAAG